MKNNANLRHVQEILGHRLAGTTERYLHLTITDLKEAHRKFHPREAASKSWQTAGKTGIVPSVIARAHHRFIFLLAVLLAAFWPTVAGANYTVARANRTALRPALQLEEEGFTRKIALWPDTRLTLENRAFGAEPAIVFFDGNGNVTAMMDGSQNVVARYLYDPFGRLIGKWGTMADVNRYRFSSKEVHPNSGLYYYGYRFYEPNLQRWLNRDPSGERGGINLYRFARNNSLSFGDPDGRGLLSFIFGEGWSGDGADAFEESIGESMMEQGAEMKAGLDVLRDDGLGASRNYLVDDMSDRYADMMLNYGEGSMYAIAANDMTGGTSLMEAIYGIDLQSQCELGKQDRWQRGLMGGGQMGLTAAFGLSLRNGGTPPPRVFYVTPDGVVLPPGPKYLIPPQLVQNPYRAGSYGMIENGKFVETLRIDPATPTGFKGPEYSHYHLDGGKTHFSPRPGQPDPGFH